MNKTERNARNDLNETRRYRATKHRAAARRDIKRRASKAARKAAQVSY